MSVRVRLTRVGSKKNPIWRVVVADQRSPRDGRVIESIGHYNPQTQPSTIVIDRERLDHWLERGAQPTNTVRKLMRSENSQMGAAAVAVEPPVDAEPAAPEPERAGESEPEGAAGSEVAAETESAPTAEADAEAEVAQGDSEPSEGTDEPSEATDEPGDSNDTPAG